MTPEVIPPGKDPSTGLGDDRAGLGIRTKLLVLLLAFGIIPMAVCIVFAYAISRDAILDRAQEALQTLTTVEAVHLGSELQKQRLVLRTIATQLPTTSDLLAMAPEERAAVLVRSLLDDGVFDGLRLSTSEGRVLASVALRETMPHWPLPATETERRPGGVVVHRDSLEVVAYIVAVRVPDSPTTWLEGHVRKSDFRRIFSLPTHLLVGVESSILQADGRPVFGTHDHAADELAALVGTTMLVDVPQTWRMGGGAGVLVSTAPVQGSDWVFATALPIKSALASLTQVWRYAVIGTTVLLILIVLTGIVASRSVTTPIRRLVEALGLLGREGRFTPLTGLPRDEVGTLIDAFNTMAANLARSRDDVERLHEREMERAQQLATVGELASGVAHEIRNPLTGVRGAVEIALRTIPEHDASRSLLVEALQQLRRIEDTTTQLLQYARPPELREILVDPALLVERAAAIVAPRAATNRQDITIEPSPTPVKVRADAELVVQVLVNLLLNGIDAVGPDGALTIWIVLRAPEVWVGVRDTGPGVAPELRRDIFRPFFTTKHRGTGLGLPISKAIMSRHGGTLMLSDTPGGGATFIITLPLADTGDDT